MAANPFADEELDAPPEALPEPMPEGDRPPGSFSEFIKLFWPRWKLVELTLSNLERERQLPNEIWTYQCLGQVSDGKGGVAICGIQVKAKRPEYRTAAEAIRCPNPLHRGELTPMEPVRG